MAGLTHALGRFHFEFLRADTERVFVRNFSEAQWFAATTGVLIAGLELAGVLPLQWWHITLAIVPTAGMVGVTVARRVSTGYAAALRQPHHFRQLIGAIKWSYDLASNFGQTGALPEVPTVATTSLGIRISAKRVLRAESITMQFEIADENAAMPDAIARKIGDLIARVAHPEQTFDLEANSDGGYRIRLEDVTTLNNLGLRWIG